MEITLVLEEECPKCEGSGVVYIRQGPNYVEEVCPKCQGRKVIVTEAGEEILALVRKYLLGGR